MGSCKLNHQNKNGVKKIIIISHQARLKGPGYSAENTIAGTELALNEGINVEVDVWGDSKGKLALGHDKPGDIVSIDFLSNPRIWVHAKDKYALEILYKSEVNYFFHQGDPFTVTSKGYNWVHIESTPLINNAIYCAFSLKQLKQLKSKVKFPIGVCTDFPLAVSDIFNE